MLPLDYKISVEPVTDKTKWGILAHVDDETRKKIMDTGFGEMKTHVDYIERQIKENKALIKNAPHLEGKI